MSQLNVPYLSHLRYRSHSLFALFSHSPILRDGGLENWARARTDVTKQNTTLTSLFISRNLFFSFSSAPLFRGARVQTVREKCFAKCITKPGSSLSSGESTCIQRCTDRYVDATRMISNVVLQAYSGGGGGGMQ